MALPAPDLDRDWPMAAPGDARTPPAEDAVSTMHRTIEAKMRLEAMAPVATPGRVEQAIQLASRAAGWATLAAVMTATLILIF